MCGNWVFFPRAAFTYAVFTVAVEPFTGSLYFLYWVYKLIFIRCILYA